MKKVKFKYTTNKDNLVIFPHKMNILITLSHFLNLCEICNEGLD